MIVALFLLAGCPAQPEVRDEAVLELQAQVAELQAAQTVKPGVVVAYAGAIAPDGWVLCDGHVYDRTDAQYAGLYQVIGNTFGGSSEESTFAVPDLRDQFVAGASETLAVGAEGGTADGAHTHMTDSYQGVIPLAHSHDQTAHNHNWFSGWAGDQKFSYDSAGAAASLNGQAVGSSYWNLLVGMDGWGASGGPYLNVPYWTDMNTPEISSALSDYDAAHDHQTAEQVGGTDNTPPFVALNYIIRL